MRFPRDSFIQALSELAPMLSMPLVGMHRAPSIRLWNFLGALQRAETSRVSIFFSTLWKKEMEKLVSQLLVPFG